MDHDEKASALVKMGGAASAASYSLTDLPLNELVALVTLIYVALQIGLLIPKYWQMVGEWRKK